MPSRRYAAPGPIPPGKVRGLALLKSGTRLGPAISRGAGVAWQGKVFDADGTSSVNRFFGVKAVEQQNVPAAALGGLQVGTRIINKQQLLGGHARFAGGMLENLGVRLDHSHR